MRGFLSDSEDDEVESFSETVNLLKNFFKVLFWLTVIRLAYLFINIDPAARD